MDNLAADFEINPNNPLNAEYELSEGVGFDCSFELYAAGTVWGSIDGNINNQTDLINLLNTKVDLTSFEELSQTVTNNYNELTGDIADLTTTVTDNYNTLSGQISDLTGVVNDNYTSLDNRLTTAEGSILNLTDTVNDNYTELNGKITATNNNLSTLSQTVQDNNTAINNRVDGIVESFDGDISDLNNAIDNLSDTVSDNYTELNDKINDNTDDITTIQNTINSYGDIVSYNAAYFATANQGALADTALQPNDNISELVNDVGYITSASLPTVNNATITIQKNGSNVGTFTLNQANNDTLNITVPTQASDIGAMPDTTTIADLTTTAQLNALNSGATSVKINQIATNTSNIASINNTISGFGNIVTHNVSEFATSAQGLLANTALQPNDNISELTNDVGYITSASLPTVNNGTLDIQVNGTSIGTFTANQSGNTTANIVVPDSATWGNITGTLSNQTDLQDALNKKQDKLTAGENITIEEQQEGWTSAVQDSNLGENNWSVVAYDGTKFVAIGYGGYVSTSTDGTTWTSAVKDSNLGENEWLGVAYGNNKFVAIGGRGYVSTSTDGTTWTSAEDSNLGDNWSVVAYDGTKFVAIGRFGYVSTSTDGTTWTPAVKDSNLGGNEWVGVAYGNNKFVAIGVGGYVSTSTDGTTWTSAVKDSNLGENEWLGVAYGNNKFVAIGYGGYVSTSTDGTTWTPAVKDSNLGENEWVRVAYGNNKFVAISEGGYVSQYFAGGTIISATVPSLAWGSITGTLSDQTDLQTALNSKYDASNPSGYITSADLPTNYVTTDTAQNISGKKTFLGEKAIYFKQNVPTDKLGFTLYNPSNAELGALEWRPNTINGNALLALNCSQSGSNYVGFRYWSGINIVAPRPTTNGIYYIPVNVTDGTNTVTANNNGTLNISSLLPDVSDMATQTWVTNQGYTTNVGTVTSVNNTQPDANGNVTLTIPDTATWGNITGTLSNQTDLQNALDAKQNTISDLPTIRSGASLGATALQPNDNISDLTDDTATYPIDKAESVVDNNSGSLTFWSGTKAQYDAIVTKDANTLYNVEDTTSPIISILDSLYPVGSIYIGTMSACPLQTLGVGTWQLVATDRVLQGAGSRGAVGTTLNESLPNIKGVSGNNSSQGLPKWTTSPTGAIYDAGASYNIGTNNVASAGSIIGFDASRSSSTYQDNAPVQQDAYLVNIWERVS